MTEPAEHDLEEAKLLLSQGRTDEAKPLLRNVIALDPANSLAQLRPGRPSGPGGTVRRSRGAPAYGDRARSRSDRRLAQSSHPLVAAGGELTFWTGQSEMPAAKDAASRQGADYLALLRRIGPGSERVTDKNPFNFLHLGAIRLALPHARFIHVRRDPIDTCLSIYFTRWSLSPRRSPMIGAIWFSIIASMSD